MGASNLEPYGMHWMDDDDIGKTLTNQNVGVLGLATEGGPCLRPLSYWFDEESDALYFLYLAGTDSQKKKLTDRADRAQFLVYSIETTFNWRSVLVTGTIEAVPDSDRAAIEEEMEISWRPDLLERATESRTTELYRLDIEEWTGIKQLELPPELREPSSEGRLE